MPKTLAKPDAFHYLPILWNQRLACDTIIMKMIWVYESGTLGATAIWDGEPQTAYIAAHAE